MIQQLLRDPSLVRTVVITRPQAPSEDWLSALRDKGLRVHHLALIEIEGPPDPNALKTVGSHVDHYQALMFVSPQAVAQFFLHLQFDMSAWRTPCWVTGGGSKAALLKAGVGEPCIWMPQDESGLWDSEHLWLRVQHTVKPAQKVLIVRGMDQHAGGPKDLSHGMGREFLSQQLIAHGLEVNYVVAYQRRSPIWREEQRQRVREFLKPTHVWVFSSSQAVSNLAEQLKGADFSQACAIVTHERIATALRDLGFGVVLLSRPDVKDVLRSLESIS